MNVRSVVLKPLGQGESVPVVGDLVVGREAGCDLVLDSGTVSGKHARLSIQAGEVWLEDLDSTNGTFVNESKLADRVQLRNGDRVRFDIVEFEVIMTVAAASQAATQVRSQTVHRPRHLNGDPNRLVKSRSNPSPEEVAAQQGAANPQASAGVATSTARAFSPPDSWSPDEGTSPVRPPRAPEAWVLSPQVASKTQLLTSEQLEALLRESPNGGERKAEIDYPYLQMLSGSLKGNYLRLQGAGDAHAWEIGSHPTRDIVLEDAGVSGFHAKLMNEGRRWKIIDQLSANGTYVNGAKVTMRFLDSGDELKFGTVTCVFRLPSTKLTMIARRRRTWAIAIVSFLVTATALLLLVNMLKI